MSAAISEPVEAVIISGTRRGQIVRLPLPEPLELRPEEIDALDQALDALNAALAKVSDEARWTLEALRPKGKST